MRGIYRDVVTSLSRLLISTILISGLLIGFGNRLPVLAQVEPIQPGSNGTVVKTSPFVLLDVGSSNIINGYFRFVVSAYGFDPVEDGDPDHDYFMVFTSDTVQAKGDGWCLGDGRQWQSNPPSPDNPVLASQKVILSVTGGKF